MGGFVAPVTEFGSLSSSSLETLTTEGVQMGKCAVGGSAVGDGGVERLASNEGVAAVLCLGTSVVGGAQNGRSCGRRLFSGWLRDRAMYSVRLRAAGFAGYRR